MDIEQELQGPTKETAGSYTHCGFNSDAQPRGSVGMKLNGLKATEEGGGAEGDPSGHSVQKEEKFALSFPQERCQPKGVHCLRDSFGEKNQSV